MVISRAEVIRMAQNVHGTFISEKTNKIRWRPDPFTYSHSFITGSWDNDENNIKLWNFEENEEDPDIYPFVIKNYPFEADVTEIKFINPDYFVAASSLGSVYYFKISTALTGETLIVEEASWKSIHKFVNGESSSCTSLAMYDNDIATTGEDGRINLLTTQKKDVVRSIDDADSCSLNCITFLKYSEILTGNLRGQMKIWDLRSGENKPSSTFMLSGDQIGATCLAFHPTQRHMIVAGDEEGSLTVWDLRQNTFPVNLLSAHSESVSEIHFHPDHPDQLFSCSSSGELWHWLTNRPGIHRNKLLSVEEETNPWLSTESIKDKFEVFMLMPKLHKPVNSLDLNRNRVLSGCDNEAIYLINNVNVYN